MARLAARPAGVLMADRTPPINLTLEATLLGQVLVKNTVYDTVSSVVRAEMFADPAHAMVWEAIATLIDEGRSATVMTLRAYLDHEKILADIGGVAYLQQLVDATMTTVNALDLAREIRTLAVLREAMATAEQIAETAAKPNLDMDVDHFLDDIDARLGRLRLAARPATGASGTMRDFADQARDEALAAYRGGAPVRGLRTGMGAIDAKLPLGFRPGHFIVLAARPAMGKAQPLSAKILKDSGEWTTMGEIEVGDWLASVDGAPSVVLGVHPRGRREVFRIILSDGRSTEACAEHLWSVHYRMWAGPRVLSTLAVAKMLTRKRYRGRLWIERHSGEHGGGVLPLDPWALGVLIGNGGFTGNTPHITSADSDIISRLAARLPAGVAMSPGHVGSYRLTSGRNNRSNPLTTILAALGLMGKLSIEKFIPPVYFRASRADRIALLAGLVDTDGNVEKHGSIVYSTSSPRLADDVTRLVRSLGGWCHFNSRPAHYTKNGQSFPAQDGHRATIILPPGLGEAMVVGHKIKRIKTMTREKRLTFEAIRPIAVEETRCISVSHPSRLYVTDDYIVTHNSALATDFAVSIAEQVWPEGRRPVVGLWSLEMSGSEIVSRIYAPRMGISATDIMGGKMTQPQAERLLVVAEEIAQLGIHIFDDFSLSPTRLRAQARILKRERGLDLVIVDYLQLMEPPEHRRRYTSRVDEVTEISRGLKSVARELDVPVLALSQLTRDVDNREDNRPRLSDLRESGSIEQDADVVMMLYRQEYYLHGRKPQTDTLNETRKIEVENAWYAALARCQGKAELSIAKARGGATGRIELDWSGTLTTFRDTHRPPDPQDTLAL